MIRSLIDLDSYKLSCSQFAFKKYPTARASFKFINRRPSDRFDRPMFSKIMEEIENLSKLRLTEKEYSFLLGLPHLSRKYINWLKDFHFNPNIINSLALIDGELILEYEDTWAASSLYETIFMSLISEVYFEQKTISSDLLQQQVSTKWKGQALSGLKFAEFGTRRRRSFDFQEKAVEVLADFPGFLGTSNLYLAMQYGLTPIGTVAHEIPMGLSAIYGAKNANHYFLKEWSEFYEGRLDIALCDTFGTDNFLQAFDWRFSRIFGGTRWDSSCPYTFSAKILDHYRKLGIDPLMKKIVYSDGLTTDYCKEINSKVKGINKVFTLGTHLTNDVPHSPALNMVVKMQSLNGIPVVKLSDSPGKHCGNPDEIDRVAKEVGYAMER